MLLVTTPINPSDLDIQYACKFAQQYGFKYVERRNSTITYLLRDREFDLACVVKNGEIKLVKEGQNYFFHPNMAMLRINNLKKGESDRLMELAEIRLGDDVLDCTLGMGSDSLVYAYSVGILGSVTGVEKSPVLAELVEVGLQEYNHRDIIELKNRIRVINQDYKTLLKELPDNSYDVIYFDPMFDNTLDKANGLDIVRDLAEYKPLELEDIQEAKRLGRRYIIIKDGAPAKTLKRLNIPIVSTGRKTCYGRIEL